MSCEIRLTNCEGKAKYEAVVKKNGLPDIVPVCKPCSKQTKSTIMELYEL